MRRACGELLTRVEVQQTRVKIPRASLLSHEFACSFGLTMPEQKGGLLETNFAYVLPHIL